MTSEIILAPIHAHSSHVSLNIFETGRLIHRSEKHYRKINIERASCCDEEDKCTEHQRQMGNGNVHQVIWRLAVFRRRKSLDEENLIRMKEKKV